MHAVPGCLLTRVLSELQAEKNLAWEAAQAQSASVAQMSSLATAGAGPCKLYIKNLHPNITVRPCPSRLT